MLHLSELSRRVSNLEITIQTLTNDVRGLRAAPSGAADNTHMNPASTTNVKSPPEQNETYAEVDC